MTLAFLRFLFECAGVDIQYAEAAGYALHACNRREALAQSLMQSLVVISSTLADVRAASGP